MSNKTTKKQKNIPVENVEVSQPVEDAVDETAPVKEDNIDAESDMAPTSAEVEATIDELAATKKRERVWEIDFVRGLMILFVVWDHFMWDVRYSGGASYNTGLFQWLYTLSGDYYSGALRNVTHDTFVTLFVFTSGVSCSFSKSNIMRALKMCAFAIAFTLITDVIASVMGVRLTIYFNVIHVVALSVLIFSGIEWIWSKCKHNWSKNIFGVVMFALIMTVLVSGYCAKYMGIHWTNLLFGESEWRASVIAKIKSGSDYLAFFPDFGWFLVGAFLGRVIYRERKSIFPSVNPKFVSPVTFCGRRSLWVYFISQVVMYGLIYLLHVMYQIL